MENFHFIHLIADYGIGDPSFGEVIQKLHNLDPNAQIVPTSVPSFSTIATGFWTLQYALVNPFPGMMIYTNTAPRKDNKGSRIENEGEHLAYALLTNGVKVVGVNAGHSFTFIKSHIRELYSVKVANRGSQFRSRDFYPEAVIGIMNNEIKFIGDKLDSERLYDIPKRRIAWIDGYGNMKTTVRKSEMRSFSSGQPILITIGSMKRTAWYSNGTFSVMEGELAFAPGSSGGKDPFMELFLRGLSAWKEMGKPAIEEEFAIEPMEIG
jgi:S-adenosylmethionine hydrolase